MTAIRVPVTQFILPNGRQRQTYIERPAIVGLKAVALVHRGYGFEAEILTTGEVHLTLSDPVEEIDLFNRITPNDDSVPTAFDSLVEEAYNQIMGKE